MEIDRFITVLGDKKLAKTSEYRRLAVVGSRMASSYGKRVCREFVYELAAAGVVIVSGLMYGIDLIAHESALNASGRTIAILGYGKDHLNKVRYAQKVVSEIASTNQGAVLSQFKTDQKPAKWTFPRRNELVASISEAVLVIEASFKSGTMITVNAALDLGKPVFAVPGSIYSETSQGTNDLIKSGAIPVTSAQDVLDYLNIKKGGAALRVKSILNKALSDDSIDGLSKSILNIFAARDVEDCLTIDEISQSMKFAYGIAVLSVSLSNLEIKGYLRRDSAGLWCIK